MVSARSPELATSRRHPGPSALSAPETCGLAGPSVSAGHKMRASRMLPVRSAMLASANDGSLCDGRARVKFRVIASREPEEMPQKDRIGESLKMPGSWQNPGVIG